MLLATDYEIAKALTDIETAFKVYNSFQRAMIVKYLKLLSGRECRLLIDRLVDDKRYQPLPNEVRQAVYGLIKERNAETSKNEVIEIEIIKCVDCYETGYNFVIVDDVATLARCLCPFGKTETESALPRFNSHMTRLEFPMSKFKPTSFEVAKRHPNQWETVQWWTGQKQIALEYWKSKNNGGVA